MRTTYTEAVYKKTEELGEEWEMRANTLILIYLSLSGHIFYFVDALLSRFLWIYTF